MKAVAIKLDVGGAEAEEGHQTRSKDQEDCIDKSSIRTGLPEKNNTKFLLNIEELKHIYITPDESKKVKQQQNTETKLRQEKRVVNEHWQLPRVQRGNNKNNQNN